MRRQLLTASALGCVAALTPSEGLANPEDGVVAAGSATIVNAPARVDIHQHSERAVIDWRSFDIAPNETTQFHQPSSSSFALNRVKSNTPSSIAGALIANGNVAVVNPNGVLIQQGAKVDVNSLVVSSADTRNEDFMAGGPLKLDIKGKPDAAVINQGTITAKEAGLVGLVAPHVENSGVIEARLGKVALASGDTAVVDLAGDGLISLAVSDSVAKQLVRNSGAVSADGGTVLITAAAGRELVDSLVTVEGTVRAQTVAEKNGAIIIASAAKGHDKTQATVKVAAKLDASGKGAGEKGGAVHVQGERILVAEATRIDASGDAGGGEVLVGGDYLGGNYRGTLATPDLAADDTAWGNTPGGYSSINGTGLAEYLRRFYDYFRPEGGMPTASRTHVGSDVVVDASARTSGHGGRVIYWSDHGTSYSGHTDVGAKGASGHGGFIEVSGRDWLGYNGSFNALATGGRAGTLLLDPTDMTISNALDNGVTGASPFNGIGPAVSNLQVATLQAALGTGNVIIQSSGGTGGNGDITFVDAVAWNNANSLTVNASRHLTVNNTITNTGTGNITLNANIATTGDLTINNNITTGGSITGLARRNLTVGALSTLTTGAAGGLSLQAANGVTTGTGNLNLNGNLSVGTGALTLTSGINGTRPNWTATNTNLVPQSGTFGTVLIQGFQDLTLNRAMSAAGNVTLLAFRDLNLPSGSNITTSAAGSISLQAANGVITGTGNLNLSSNLSVANGGNLTLTSGVNGTRPNWTATNTNLTVNGGTSFTNITIQGFQDITLNRAINAAGNIGVQAFRDLNLPLGSDITTSAGGSISLQAANANINGTGNLNLASNVSVGLGGNLTLTSGVNGTRPNWTATNTNLTVNGGTNFSNIAIQGFRDLTLNRPLTTNAAANSITLLAMRDLNIPAGSNITLANGATGAVSLRAAGGNVLGTGNFNLGANLAVGTGALTLLSGSNGTRPDLTLNTTNLSLVTGAANFGSIDIRGFNNNFVNRAITSGGSVLVYAFRDLNVNNPIVTAVAGALDLRAANGSTTGTGNLNLGAPLSVGTGGLTLMSGINGTRPDWTATTTNLVMLGATFGTVFIDGFNNFTLNRLLPSNGNVLLRSFRDLNVSAGNNITTGTTGFLTLQAANGVTTGTGNLNILSNLSVGTGALTLTSGINGTRPTWTADNFSLNRLQTTFGAIAIGGFEDFIVNRILNSNAAVAFSSNNRVTLGSDVSSGGTGALTFTNSPVVVASGASVNLSSTNQAITFNAASTVNGTAGGAAETLTVNSGTATTTFSGAVNELNLTANAGTFSLGAAMGATTAMGNVSLTSTNALTLPAITASTILARTTGAAADITLGANLTANATTGTSITLAAGRDLNNSGNRLLNTSGTARWLVYSGDTANATIIKGGLTGAFNRYGCNFGGSCPTGVTIPAAGNGFVYTFRPTATLTSVSAANKVYDGLTTATVDTSAAFISGGLLPGDSPTPDYTLATANFADKNVGTGKIVTLSGVTDNMGYLYTTSITSDITAKALTVSGFAVSGRTYNGLGDTSATITSNGTLTGGGTASGDGRYITGDTVSIATGGSASFGSGAAGTQTATGSLTLTGTDAGNYNLTAPTATATISARAITLKANDQTQTYGAGNTLTNGYAVTTGSLATGDTISSVGLSTAAATSTSGHWQARATPWTINAAGASGTGGFNSSNYAITYDTGNLTINPKALTVSGFAVSGRTYNGLGDTSATITSNGTLTGGSTASGDGRFITGDTVTIATGGSASFGSGAAGTQTATGSLTLTDVDAGNYLLTAPTATATISARAITLTANDQTQTYGAGNTLTNGYAVTTGSLATGDTISSVGLSTAAATSTSGHWQANPTPWTINAAGASGTGGFNSSNYAITYNTGNLTVNQRSLNVTSSGGDKTYNGTGDTTPGSTFALANDALATGPSGLADVVTQTGTSAFTNANAGLRTISTTGIVISGADAGNYILASPTATNTATISARAITLKANDQTQTYGAGNTFTNGYAVTTGSLATGDTISSVGLSTAATTSTSGHWQANGTPWTINAAGASGTGGFNSSNYAITYNTGNLTVNQRSLNVTSSGGDKIYNGTGDTTPGSTFALANDALVTGPSGLADVVTQTGTSAFTNANAGLRTISTTGIVLGGADAGNYILALPTAANTATISARAITLTANDQTQTYGAGNTFTNGYALTTGSLATGDTISSVGLSTAAATSTSGHWQANATPWTINAAGASGTGGFNSSNYAITYNTGNLTVNQRSVTVNGVTASNKVYDALTSATLSFASAMITGVLGSDAVIIDTGAASGVFADKNVGAGKAVTVSGVGITGADAGNYILASQPAGLVADISPATLTVTADNKSRELSQPTPPFTYTATGLVPGETTSLITGVLMSSIGSGAVPIGNYAITIGGGTAPNYVLNYVNGVLTVLADGSSLPPTPTPGGTVTTPNLDTQSSLLLSLATNQSGNFTITQPGLTAQGQQMYLNTSALNSPTLLAAGGIDTADMETRTYRLTPAGAASSINVTDDAAAAPVLIVPKMTAPIFPPTPFKIPEVMDI